MNFHAMDACGEGAPHKVVLSSEVTFLCTQQAASHCCLPQAHAFFCLQGRCKPKCVARVACLPLLVHHLNAKKSSWAFLGVIFLHLGRAWKKKPGGSSRLEWQPAPLPFLVGCFCLVNSPFWAFFKKNSPLRRVPETSNVRLEDS